MEAIVSEQIRSKAQVCEVLTVSRSAFHVWQKRVPTQHKLEDALLCPIISRIFQQHRRCYGTRRIVSDLQELICECSRRRVSRLMKTLGLRAIQPNSFVPKTTQSRHRLGYSLNLLADDPEVRLGETARSNAIVLQSNRYLASTRFRTRSMSRLGGPGLGAAARRNVNGQLIELANESQRVPHLHEFFGRLLILRVGTASELAVSHQHFTDH